MHRVLDPEGPTPWVVGALVALLTTATSVAYSSAAPVGTAAAALGLGAVSLLLTAWITFIVLAAVDAAARWLTRR